MKTKDMNDANVDTTDLWEETVSGGGMWSGIIPRGHVLRLTDLEGGANVPTLLYNADQFLERYNMADTLKAQHVAFITQGRALYSDMGRILFSVVADTCGWHDTICGHTTASHVEVKYGASSYQDCRNAFHRNARDNFLIELGKWGLGKKDLVPSLNFFSKVTVDEGGNLHYQSSHSRAGQYIELRAEMNVLVVLNTCQHLLDPAELYDPKSIRLTVRLAARPAADDPCRISRPENGRGFINTEKLFLQPTALSSVS